MADKTVVISIFANEAAADAAVVSLKDAGVANVDQPLGGLGSLRT